MCTRLPSSLPSFQLGQAPGTLLNSLTPTLFHSLNSHTLLLSQLPHSLTLTFSHSPILSLSRSLGLSPAAALPPSSLGLVWLTEFHAPAQAADGVGFWDDVYGFDMRSVGALLTADAIASPSVRVAVGAQKRNSPRLPLVLVIWRGQSFGGIWCDLSVGGGRTV